LQLLRGKDCIWRNLTAETPCGIVIPVFVGADKNRKQQLTEIYTKKLRKILWRRIADSGVQGRVHALKHHGLVTFKWKPLARVSPHADGTFVVHWNPQIVTQSGINMEETLAEVEGAVGTSSDGVQWSL
jgi:hypothetical protein